MTYDQAMDTDTTVTEEAARIEIEEMHSLPFDEFVKEYGRHDTYKSRDVLIWLGY